MANAWSNEFSPSSTILFLSRNSRSARKAHVLARQNEEPNFDWWRNTDATEIVWKLEIAEVIFQRNDQKYICCSQAMARVDRGIWDPHVKPTRVSSTKRRAEFWLVKKHWRHRNRLEARDCRCYFSEERPEIHLLFAGYGTGRPWNLRSPRKTYSC